MSISTNEHMDKNIYYRYPIEHLLSYQCLLQVVVGLDSCFVNTVNPFYCHTRLWLTDSTEPKWALKCVLTAHPAYGMMEVAEIWYVSIATPQLELQLRTRVGYIIRFNHLHYTLTQVWFWGIYQAWIVEERGGLQCGPTLAQLVYFLKILWRMMKYF